MQSMQPDAATFRRVIVLCLGACVVTIAGTASAQLPKTEQKCLDRYNNKLRLVSAAQNKENRACIKNATKGKNPAAADPEACLTLDSKSKIAKKQQAVVDATSGAKGKCDPIVGTPVAGIYFDPQTGIDAHTDAAIQLAHALFGSTTISGTSILPGTFNPADKQSGKCQDKIYQRAHQLMDAATKEFRGCEKQAMKFGSVTDNLTLEACVEHPSLSGSLTADTKGKLSKKILKLGDDFAKNCDSVDLDTLFPGACVGGGLQGTFLDCAAAQAECAACVALNGADNMDADCDSFDDGMDNNSCPPSTPVDIILFVDNSASMGLEVAALQDNINESLGDLLEAAGIDYRVILIARHGPIVDESVCIEAPLSGIAAGGCVAPPAQPVNNPPKFFHYSVEIASHNAWCVLLNTFTASDEFGLFPNGWSEVVRAEAFKVIIGLTDDGVQCSFGGDLFDDNNGVTDGQTASSTFDTALLALSPTQFGTAGQRRYVAHSIVGMAQNAPPEAAYLPTDPITTSLCPTAGGPGTGYQALSVLTGGLRFGLCITSVYDEILATLSAEIIDLAFGQ